ncbi:hypothetical protein Pmani_011513 [Petrolisthes manimaculis]|uniref:Uncharacterized protein n=1 Tax=Petrolisthes manimaculis TaxID=1843537 RepID=A0AAE1PZC2_9EUCA|nr:hypothetical protein Pmani_011513 [Petrolisthes manimaculis]
MKTLEDRCNYQEDHNRRNNLRFSGIEEQRGGESWEQTAEMVKSVIASKMQIPDINIERAHRTGKPLIQGHRIIVVRFATFVDRELVMRNTNKLKNTNIYVNEDLCAASQALVKSQIPVMKKARSEGKLAYFRHTTLVIKEKNGTYNNVSKTSSATSTTTTTPATTSGNQASVTVFPTLPPPPTVQPTATTVPALPKPPADTLQTPLAGAKPKNLHVDKRNLRDRKKP